MNENAINRKISLMKSGLTAAAVARSLGVCPQAVSNEIYGAFKSKRIRKELCRVTNSTPEEFWPEIKKEVDCDGYAAQT